MISLSFLFLLCVHFAFVDAALFILAPFKHSTCQGGQPCNVTWEENGESPLLSRIGIVTVALYTGKQELVQALPPVNVAATSHFSFTPSPAAGPDSDDYYIAMISTEINDTQGLPYVAYSAFFGLRDMSGSFGSQLPAATSTFPIPESIKNPSTPSETATATIGSLSTSLSSSLSASSSVAASRFSTSQTHTSTSSATPSSTSATAKKNGSPRHLPGPLPVLFMALFTFAFFA